MAERRGACRVLVGIYEGRKPLGIPIVYGRMILKWIIKKYFGKAWTGLNWFRIGTRWAIVNTVMNFRDQNGGHFLAIRGNANF
jgi:hypothetical protein